MTREATREDILRKYIVISNGIESTGWTKHITLKSDKREYVGRLHWDSHDGYSMYWDGISMPEEAYLPEFEYVLDSITEGHK